MNVDLEEMIKIADQAIAPLSYGSREQLFRLLLKGIFVNDGTSVISFYFCLFFHITGLIELQKCLKNFQLSNLPT